MLRSELIQNIADSAEHINTELADRILAVMLDSVTETLAEGGRVELRGFGSFTVRDREARRGRNPRTGEPVDVPAKRVPHFKPGREMRIRVNGGTDPEARSS